MRYFQLFFLAFLVFSCTSEKEQVTYPSLVNRLIDLRALAVLPGAGEESAMWSSYDRKSKIDPDTGEFINWEANDDGLTPQFIRKEGDNEVLAEMEGPGAIVRIWSASPMEGKVKIYIDGKEEPVLDLPFIDYFKPAIKAFDFPALVYETNARGFNNYVPITYQKSCKIVAEPGWGQYYHFNFISFPENTQVAAFNPDPDEGSLAALQNVNSFFAEKLGENPHGKSEAIEEIAQKVASGERKLMFSDTNPGALSSIKVKVHEKDSAKIEEILRKVTLEIFWDEEENPAVWTPLGDFFGTSPGWNKYHTLPMGMTEEWMYSYWYMPYTDGAQVWVHNEYKDVVEVEMQISHEELEGEKGKYGRFHAKWHRDIMPVEEAQWPDWTLLKTEGKGRFVGTHLLVWNPKGGSCSLGGPGHHWWGEGDEKFFIDGEDFPSTFGTGTEDYFGYAWCDPSKFEHAFHSQTLDNDNMGYQPMNRWHIIDNIPFQKSFEGYMEKYFPNHWPTQYSAVVYWYMEPGGNDPLERVPVAERFGFETPFEVYREEGVVEGEILGIGENSGGWASTDVWANEKLYDEVSGHKILIWHSNPGNENNLTTRFEWPQAGTYLVEANIIKTENGGEFALALNENNLEKVNFRSKNKNPETEKIALGRVTLEPGFQELKIKYTGADAESKNLGIDYIRFIEQ